MSDDVDDRLLAALKVSGRRNSFTPQVQQPPITAVNPNAGYQPAPAPVYSPTRASVSAAPGVSSPVPVQSPSGRSSTVYPAAPMPNVAPPPYPGNPAAAPANAPAHYKNPSISAGSGAPPLRPSVSVPTSSRSSITAMPLSPSGQPQPIMASPTGNRGSIVGIPSRPAGMSVSADPLSPEGLEPARTRSTPQDPRLSQAAIQPSADPYGRPPTMARSSTVGQPPAPAVAPLPSPSSSAGLSSNAILEAQQRALVHANRGRTGSIVSGSANAPGVASPPAMASPTVSRQASMSMSAASPRGPPPTSQLASPQAQAGMQQPLSPSGRGSISGPGGQAMLTPEQIAIARQRRKEAEEAALALAMSLSLQEQQKAPEKSKADLELEAAIAASKAEADRNERKLRALKAKEEEALALAQVLSASELEEKQRLEKAKNSGPTEEQIIRESILTAEEEKQRKFERDAMLGRLHAGQIPAQAVHDEIIARAKKRTAEEARQREEQMKALEGDEKKS